MKVYIVRHGESEANKNDLWSGWLDVALTEKGKQDAMSAGKILSGVSFDKIYSSDLSRAKNTAEIAISGCEYETSPLLREFNAGSITGKKHDIISDEEKAHASINGYSAYGGESIHELEQRVLEFMHKLETLDCENVAVFSHDGFLRSFLDMVINARTERKNICCHNCTVAIFEYNGEWWALNSWINLR